MERLKQPTIRYSYVDVPTIEKFSLSKAFIRAIMGPFGSGKSSGCVWEIFQRAMNQRPGLDGIRRSRWAVIRNTYPELKSTTIKTWTDWFREDYFGNVKWDIPITHHIRVKDIDLEVLFLALDRPQDTKKLLSLEVTGVWINECREVPLEIFDAATARVGRYPSMREGGASWWGVIADTNPPDTDHWFYRLFEEMQFPEDTIIKCSTCWLRFDLAKHRGQCPDCENKMIELFKQPSGRSPQAENLLNLPNNYYGTLAIGKDPEFIKAYIDGLYAFTRDGKAVYHSYNDARHVAITNITPIPQVPIYLGWDYGLTPSCVIGQLTPAGHLNILQEIVSNGMGIRRFARDVIAPILRTDYYNMPKISTGDPSGNSRSETDESTCIQELKDAGIPTKQARTNNIVARIGAVESFLTRTAGDGKPTFQLSPKCMVLRKGFNGGYHYRRMQLVGTERYTDEPEKNEYSHPHDALQYLCLEIDNAAQITQRQINSNFKTTGPAIPAGALV